MGSKWFIVNCLLLLMLVCSSSKPYAQTTATAPTECDQICGKWMSTEKNLSVEVYKDGADFKAKIIWFDDADDKTQPMDTRMDTSNPDEKLRSRKILGMSVLEKLQYEAKTHTWENGVIYDASHGRYWDSSAYIAPDGCLKVTGYWHFKFIGKTLTFTRL